MIIKCVIKSPEELKNEIYAYIVMNRWMTECGEDLVDSYTSIAEGNKVLDWLLDKKYIDKEKYETILSKKETELKDILFGYETGIFKNAECSFPSTNKSYQLLAEYISNNKESRKELFEFACINGEYNSVYEDENENIISSCIYEEDLRKNTITKEEWLKDKFNSNMYFGKCSYIDEYNILKSMSIEETDYDIDELK